MNLLTILIFALVLSFRGACAQLVSTEYDSLARATIRNIREAARIFHWDKGNWPRTVEDLTAKNYLTIDSTTNDHWQFYLVDGPPSVIKAVSKDPFDTDKYDVSPALSYNVLNGEWQPLPETGSEKKFSLQMRAEVADDVRNVMDEIWQWTKTYYEDRGIWPETVGELKRLRYIEIDVGVDSTWQFAFIGKPPQSIVAVSKPSMQEGEGHAIEYDVANDTWRGYGKP